MPHFRADMQVKTDCVLALDVRHIDIPLHALGARIVLRSGPAGESGVSEWIDAEVYANADTIDEAPALLRSHLADALDCLCYLTSVRYLIERVTRVIEWDAGKKTRVFKALHTVDHRFPPQPALGAGFGRSVAELCAAPMPKYVRRGIQCYRKAMITPRVEDQFLEFWRALEVLAEAQKGSAASRIKCRRCEPGFLVCEVCGDGPERVQTAAEAMRQLLAEIKYPDSDTFFGILKRCRDKLTHGSSEESVSREIGRPLHEVVGELSRCVWTGLRRAMPPLTEPVACFPPTGDVVVPELIAGVTGEFDHTADGDHPPNEELPTVKVSLTVTDGPRSAP